MIRITLAAALASLVLCDTAAAQAPPMDMSWAIQSQIQNQRTGDRMARQAGRKAYRMLKRARARGHPYNGTLVLGNHPNSFGDGGYAARSNATHRALTDHDLRATRGCTRLHRDKRGNTWYSC